MIWPSDVILAVLRELEPRITVGGLVGAPLDVVPPAASAFDRRFCAPSRSFSATLQSLLLVDKAWHDAVVPLRARLVVVSAPRQLAAAVERFTRRSAVAADVRTLIVGDVRSREFKAAAFVGEIVGACTNAVAVVVYRLTGASLPATCRTFCIHTSTGLPELSAQLAQAAGSLEELCVGQLWHDESPATGPQTIACNRLRALSIGRGGLWEAIGPGAAGSLRALRLEVDWGRSDSSQMFAAHPPAITLAVIDGVWPWDLFRPPVLSWLPRSVDVVALGWNPASWPDLGTGRRAGLAEAVEHVTDELEEPSVIPNLRRIHQIPPPQSRVAEEPQLRDALIRFAAVCASRDMIVVDHQPGSPSLLDICGTS